jgi:hypothetical protein
MKRIRLHRKSDRAPESQAERALERSSRRSHGRSDLELEQKAEVRSR